MIAPASIGTSRAPAALSPQEALASARRIAVLVREEAAETEARTYYSERLHREFLEAGFYHLLRPRTFGGYEFALSDFLAVMREIARADVGTAWCLTLGSGHNLQLASLWPEAVQRELFGGPYLAAPMVSAPTGTLRRVDGGFRLDSKHPYASGAPYSTHFSGHAFHEDRPGVVSTFVAPRSAYTVLDDWGRTLGLRGSGSHSVLFEDAFLPAEYVLEGVNQVALDVSNGTPGTRLHGNPLYGASEIAFFSLELANLAIGGALAAFDEYEALMPVKRTTLPPFPLRAEDGLFQQRYGLAAARLEIAIGAFDRAASIFDEAVQRPLAGGVPITPAEDVRAGLIANQSGELAWRGVEEVLFKTVGSSAATSGSRLERIWRDLSQWWGHVQNGMTEHMAGELARARFAAKAEGAA